MKIHSDTLSIQDIYECVPRGCFLAEFWSHRGGGFFTVEYEPSRSHEHGYIVRLSGSSPYHMQGLPEKAATYDEWGEFLAALFSRDENMKAGIYKDASDFDLKTEHRFPLVAA